jgi:hypothetical protein
MAFDRLYSFKSDISSELDTESGRITLRAHLKGNATCDAGDTPERLRTSGLLPNLGEPFPDNQVMVCKRVHCEKVQPLLIEFECDYGWTTPAPPSGGGGGGPGAIPQHWQITLETVKGHHPIDRDAFGVPMMTVTRERFDPALTEDKSDLAFVFSTENRPFNDTLLDMYMDSVSSDVFRGKMPGACKIDDIRATVSRRTDGPDTMSCQIRVIVGRPPPGRKLFERFGPESWEWRPITEPPTYYTWHKRVRGEGYYVFDSSIGDMREARDVLGSPELKPVLHSIESGSSSGEIIRDPEAAEFYAFKTKHGLPFQTLFNAL